MPSVLSMGEETEEPHTYLDSRIIACLSRAYLQPSRGAAGQEEDVRTGSRPLGTVLQAVAWVHGRGTGVKR